MEKYLRKWGVVFTGPTLIAFVIAFLVPFFMGLYLSFTDFTTITDAQFNGVQNYVDAFSARQGYGRSLLYTAGISLVSIITVNVGAFILAFLLTRKLAGTNFFRTVFFMPNLIGGIVLGYTWQAMLNAVLKNWGQTIVW